MDHLHSVLAGPIARRDTLDCRDADGWLSTDLCPELSFWYTRTGYIVKWSLFLGLTTLLLVYLLVGYLHAKSRLKKGLAPLGYHRFLVARRDLARVDPRYRFPPPNNVYYYDANSQQPPGPGGAAPAYGMYAMPPPPVYDPNAPRPPVYQYDVEAGAAAGSAQPPTGATKVDPSQSAAPVQRPADQQAEQYEAPPGPPPIQSQNTGSTNPFFRN